VKAELDGDKTRENNVEFSSRDNVSRRGDDLTTVQTLNACNINSFYILGWFS
jgi:hypothetical protein